MTPRRTMNSRWAARRKQADPPYSTARRLAIQARVQPRPPESAASLGDLPGSQILAMSRGTSEQRVASLSPRAIGCKREQIPFLFACDP